MIQHLQKLSKQELLKVAAEHGVVADKRHSEATIIQEILTKAEPKQMRAREQREEPKEAVYNEPADVELAIAKIKERKPEFQTEYNVIDQTVHFRCRGAEECHNLSVPLKQLVKRAEYVSRGAVALRTRPEFERGAYKGYADTVLA